MANIQPITFPIIGDATKLNVLVLNFTTDATTCTLYYQLITEDDRQCAHGNYILTEAEFAAWGEDNAYIDNLIAVHLGITLLPDTDA